MRVLYKNKTGTQFIIKAVSAMMDSRGLVIYESESKFYHFSMPPEKMQEAINTLYEFGYANLHEYSPT